MPGFSNAICPAAPVRMHSLFVLCNTCRWCSWFVLNRCRHRERRVFAGVQQRGLPCVAGACVSGFTTAHYASVLDWFCQVSQVDQWRSVSSAPFTGVLRDTPGTASSRPGQRAGLGCLLAQPCLTKRISCAQTARQVLRFLHLEHHLRHVCVCLLTTVLTRRLLLCAGTASLDVFGIFDGHGGKQAAAFASKHLVATLLAELHSSGEADKGGSHPRAAAARGSGGGGVAEGVGPGPCDPPEAAEVLGCAEIPAGDKALWRSQDRVSAALPGALCRAFRGVQEQFFNTSKVRLSRGWAAQPRCCGALYGCRGRP